MCLPPSWTPTIGTVQKTASASEGDVPGRVWRSRGPMASPPTPGSRDLTRPSAQLAADTESTLASCSSRPRDVRTGCPAGGRGVLVTSRVRTGGTAIGNETACCPRWLRLDAMPTDPSCPCLPSVGEIEAAEDHILGDQRQTSVGTASMLTHHCERLGHLQVPALRQDSLGLLDDDARLQGYLELRGQLRGARDRSVLQDSD